MTSPPPSPDQSTIEQDQAVGQVVLELYVASTLPRSVEAISTIRQMCQRFFKGRYALKVFDLARSPQLAGSKQILAVPTLIKVEPGPSRRIIGDFADPARIAAALGLPLRSKVA